MNTIKQVWANVIGMLEAPFVGELDLVHLFLLVGVVLIFIAVWAVVLHYVRLATME